MRVCIAARVHPMSEIMSKILYTVRGKIKQSPKKTIHFLENDKSILLYFYQIMSRDITSDSENFHSYRLFGRKQKLQLSKVKIVILQLNTRYYHNCYISV